MFHVYVTHPTCTFTANPRPETTRDTLESAIDYAFNRIAEIVPDCRVTIETEKGESLALMN